MGTLGVSGVTYDTGIVVDTYVIFLHNWLCIMILNVNVLSAVHVENVFSPNYE